MHEGLKSYLMGVLPAVPYIKIVLILDTRKADYVMICAVIF